MTSETKIPLPPGEDAKTSDHDKRPKVRIASHGGSYGGRGDLHMDIHGLDSKELELMEGALHGHQWVTCIDGRIEHVPTYQELPGPAEDEVLLPFWRRPVEGVETQLSLFSHEPVPAWSSPSITISSLCGYNYSTDNYRLYASMLTRWGFECLRSQRDDAGRFHEQWYLAGLWAAKEELKAVIDALDPFALEHNSAEEFLRDVVSPRKKQKPPKNEEERRKRALETTLTFLGRKVQFGTLDVSVQKMAMAID